MSNYANLKQRGDIPALTITTGLVVPVVIDPKTPINTGCTLLATTYYFPFGGELASVPAECSVLSLSAMWNSVLAATMTIEATNCAATVSGSGAAQGAATDLLDYDSTVGWVQIDPTLTGNVYAAVTGSSNTMTKYTAVAGAAAAGGAIWSIPMFAFKRFRLKVVVTVGGLLRVTTHGKLGA